MVLDSSTRQAHQFGEQVGKEEVTAGIASTFLFLLCCAFGQFMVSCLFKLMTMNPKKLEESMGDLGRVLHPEFIKTALYSTLTLFNLITSLIVMGVVMPVLDYVGLF